jgi:hypothetical protein
VVMQNFLKRVRHLTDTILCNVQCRRHGLFGVKRRIVMVRILRESRKSMVRFTTVLIIFMHLELLQVLMRSKVPEDGKS